MADRDKKSSASFVPFRPLDSLFEPTVQERPSRAQNSLTNLPLDDLYSFKDIHLSLQIVVFYKLGNLFLYIHSKTVKNEKKY